MNLITWVIDKSITRGRHEIESPYPSLAEAARQAGHTVIETDIRTEITAGHRELPKELARNINDLHLGKDSKDKPIIFHGSHRFIKMAQASFPSYSPIAYCRTENLRYSTYSAYHGTNMLNSTYEILPFEEFVRRYKNSSRDVFIRPNEVTKSFTGRIIPFKDFDLEIRSLRQIERVWPETLCVVAPVAKILKEFRCVIADRKVIATSQYSWNDDDIMGPIDKECMDLAEKVAWHGWQPDRVYVCDIALEDVGFGPPQAGIIEMNAFSCSGLYACDTHEIVHNVSKAAWEEHEAAF